MQILIHNATLVLPDRVIEGGWLLIEDGYILDLGEATTCPPPGRRVINAGARFLLPGLIDLHCDAIEKVVEPRPRIHFDIHTALQEADWRLAGNGITTEFHAISLDDNEFGVRSESFMHDLCQTIEATREQTLIRHKIHARLELTSRRGSEILAQVISQHMCDLVSLMDHSPGQGQYRTEQAFREYVARTTGRSDGEIDELLAFKRAQIPEIPRRIEQVTQLARESSLALATHDDDTVAKVEQWPSLGVTVSEFPATIEAASRAHELGLAVCMGAPNALRGRSSGGNLSAIEAIQAGIVDVLCSDYYPTAMLGAVFIVARQQELTLSQATNLVTLNPARAIGLDKEYGSLEVGKVADVILVGKDQQGTLKVQWLCVGGEEKLRRA